MYLFAYATYSKTTVSNLRPRVSIPALMTPWDRTSALEKLAEAYDVIHSLGGEVFTLRLSQKIAASAEASADPARFMSKRIISAFGRARIKLPHFAFFLEVTQDDRHQLHLHGAISLGNLDRASVKVALRRAGGKIEGPGAARQLEIKRFELDRGGPVGWACYPTKAVALTRRVLGHEKLIYIVTDLKRLARSGWQQRRQATV